MICVTIAPKQEAQMNDLRDLIDVSEAAAIIGVSRRRVQAMCKSGRLPAALVGNSYVIRRADAERVRDEEREAGRPHKKQVS